MVGLRLCGVTITPRPNQTLPFCTAERLSQVLRHELQKVEFLFLECDVGHAWGVPAATVR